MHQASIARFPLRPFKQLVQEDDRPVKIAPTSTACGQQCRPAAAAAAAAAASQWDCRDCGTCSTPHDVRHCDAMLCVVSVVRQA